MKHVDKDIAEFQGVLQGHFVDTKVILRSEQRNSQSDCLVETDENVKFNISNVSFIPCHQSLLLQ